MESQFKLDVSAIAFRPGEVQEIDIIGSIDSLKLGDVRIEINGPVKLTGRLENATTGIVFSGRVRVNTRLSCFRCLEDYDFPQDIEVYEFFAFPDSSEAEDSEYVVDGDYVDLEPAIKEEILLGMPIKHLCREDCAGICPGCGVNRNKEECSCPPAAEDERWNKLKELFVKDPGRKEDQQ